MPRVTSFYSPDALTVAHQQRQSTERHLNTSHNYTESSWNKYLHSVYYTLYLLNNLFIQIWTILLLYCHNFLSSKCKTWLASQIITVQQHSRANTVVTAMNTFNGKWHFSGSCKTEIQKKLAQLTMLPMCNLEVIRCNGGMSVHGWFVFYGSLWNSTHENCHKMIFAVFIRWFIWILHSFINWKVF